MIDQIKFGLKSYKPRNIIFNLFSLLIADYVIVSFQKCGKTWLRMMLAKGLQMKYGIKKIKLDLQLMTLFTRAPNILISHGGSTTNNNNIDFKKLFKNKKKILLVRDPRDIVVSLYHGSRTRDKVYHGDNISKFIRDEEFGFPKIIKFMNNWANERYLLVRYEDLELDRYNQLKNIFNYMNIERPDKILNGLVEFGKFENMRRLEMANKIKDYRMKPGDIKDPNSYRTRKGKIGGYKDELNDEDIRYVDEYMKRLDKKYGYTVT